MQTKTENTNTRRKIAEQISPWVSDFPLEYKPKSDYKIQEEKYFTTGFHVVPNVL